MPMPPVHNVSCTEKLSIERVLVKKTVRCEWSVIKVGNVLLEVLRKVSVNLGVIAASSAALPECFDGMAHPGLRGPGGPACPGLCSHAPPAHFAAFAPSASGAFCDLRPVRLRRILRALPPSASGAFCDLYYLVVPAHFAFFGRAMSCRETAWEKGREAAVDHSPGPAWPPGHSAALGKIPTQTRSPGGATENAFP